MKLIVEEPTSHHINVRIETGNGATLIAGIDGNILALLGPRATPLQVVRMLSEAVNDAFRMHDLQQRGIPEVGATMRVKGGTEPRSVVMVDDDRQVLQFDGDEQEFSWSAVEYLPVAS